MTDAAGGPPIVNNAGMDATREALRYPLGRFVMPDDPLAACDAGIDRIEQLPGELRAAVEGLSDTRLDTPYRPQGWTSRQVVHHVADSHLNAYVRLKIAATEDRPEVRLYDEVRWAELTDGRESPVAVSLDLVDALHRRWVAFLRSLDAAARARRFVHPGLGELTIAQTVAMYAWHGRHHVEHIASLRRRRGWS